MMKFQWKQFAVVALCVVAMVGCATGGGYGMSDEDTIRGIVQDAMDSLAAGDIDAMMVAYADDFESDQGGGIAETKEFLVGAKEQGFLDDIKYSLESLEITVDGDTAKAGPAELEGVFGALTLEFELTKRDGQWLVTYQSQY
ncbi:MAG: nuclear transport factor 2 family protein [Candidatus Hydrogenedentes bacterium]|nr:nuclear transport factor 2 family protein [Candidatus Hydrogenedentota bacterium]